MSRKKIIIIGGGAAGLMAAENLCADFEVSIYEKGKTVGRKFLVAGKGGFNLTNEATGKSLAQKYSPVYFLEKVLLENDSVKMRAWLEGLGIPTFVGTSGRVFPKKGIKPIDVLKKIKDRLVEQGVQFFYQQTFIGFDKKCNVIVKSDEKRGTLEADYFVFALGGASWSVTGSDGKWLEAFEQIGVSTHPFQSSNCGVNISWSDHFKKYHAGKPLKNIAVAVGEISVKGEAMITDYGLEGNAIYPLIGEVRKAFNQNKIPKLSMDLKPKNTTQQLLEKLKNKTPKTKIFAQSLNLNTTQIALLKSFLDKDKFLQPIEFINGVKHLQISIDSLRPLEEAISTVGGIALEEVNADFSLKKFPHIFVIGEMLDWDAPTGGFLLQGCFSMAQGLGKNGFLR